MKSLQTSQPRSIQVLPGYSCISRTAAYSETGRHSFLYIRLRGMTPLGIRAGIFREKNFGGNSPNTAKIHHASERGQRARLMTRSAYRYRKLHLHDTTRAGRVIFAYTHPLIMRPQHPLGRADTLLLSTSPSQHDAPKARHFLIHTLTHYALTYSTSIMTTKRTSSPNKQTKKHAKKYET